MVELHLLTPAESTLLLLPREAVPRRGELRDFVRERVPFSLTDCTIRVGLKPFPDGSGRLPILVMQPHETSGKATGRKPRLWFHPLLIQLFLHRRGRVVTVDWGTHQDSLSGELRPLPRSGRRGVVQRGALFQIARRHRVALLWELLLHLRLLPILAGIDPQPLRRSLLPLLALAASATVALSTFAGQPSLTAASVPQITATAFQPISQRKDVMLISLTTLLTELLRIQEEGFTLSVEELEGSEAYLRVRLRASLPDEIADKLLEALPRATAVVNSDEWLLAEAAGSLTVTLPLP